MDMIKLLKIATIFRKYAQLAQGPDPKAQLIGLSNKLSNPVPAPADQTIDTALISTLQREVDQTDYQERFPITRPESKSAVRVLYNAVKQFHVNLTKPVTGTPTVQENKTKTGNLIADFQRVINEWSNYKRSYLNESFLTELESAKSTADPSQTQAFNNRLLLWRRIIKQIDETISNIDKILKDQLTGNPDVPLEATPV